MFLGTTVALKPGERLRAEIMDRERGFIVEGEVARVHRVSVALRQVEQPGVGVRFLPPADLVTELLRGQKSRTGSMTLSRVDFGQKEQPSGDSEPSPSSERDAPPPVARQADGPGDVIPVEFVDRASFLAVYHRDIAAGGLFVTTSSPSPLHATVTIELRPPVRTPHPLRFEARVVHRFDTGSADAGGRNAVAGMGVQFLDPDRVRTSLAPILIELRR